MSSTQKQIIMSNFLENLIAPQLDYEGLKQDEKFVELFSNLYRIELFKEGLDLEPIR